MASKFSGALAALRSHPDAPAEMPPEKAKRTAKVATATVPAVPTEKPGRGRPRGKRSNPDYEPTTLLLRKATKRAASRKLEDEGSTMDLSDLVEMLLRQHIME